MYLLVRYDTGTSDNNITCEMSTLIADRLTESRPAIRVLIAHVILLSYVHVSYLTRRYMYSLKDMSHYSTLRGVLSQFLI